MLTLQDASDPLPTQRVGPATGAEVSSQEVGSWPDEGGAARAELELERRGLGGAWLP